MTDWKSVAVEPGASLGDAIRKIDESAQQVALVVGADQQLLGIVTDGDVRRAILKGMGVDAPIQAVMNSRPAVLPLGATPSEQAQKMQERSIRHLPLVDVQGRIIALSTLAEQISLSRKDNRVVLMAGGLGSRLSPLTDDCPKPMLKVGGKPLLETIIDAFAEQGFYRISISVNYLSDVVMDHFGDGSKWGLEIEYLQETQRLGTAGALGLLKDRGTEPLFVMNADLLTKVNFAQMLDFHTHHGASATMGVREHEFQIPYGVVKTDDHRILDIQEKPINRQFVNAGVYVIAPGCIDRVPKDQFFDMPSLFSSLIESGQEAIVFPIREYWLDIGRIDDYHRADGEYKEIFR